MKYLQRLWCTVWGMCWVAFSYGQLQHSEWKRADSLMALGFYADAEVPLTQIYLESKVKGWHADYYQAFLKKLIIISYTRENSEQEEMAWVEAELETAPSPLREILWAMKGRMYYQAAPSNYYYYEEKSTDIRQDTSSDFRTWTREHLLREAEIATLNSLQNASRTQKLRFADYAFLFEGDSILLELDASLYDFLALQAMYFLKETESGPKEVISLNDPQLWTPGKQFAGYRLPSGADSTRLGKMVQIWQSLILAQGKAKEPLRTYLDITRIQDWNDLSAFISKDSLQYAGLLAIKAECNETASLAQAYEAQLLMLMNPDASLDGIVPAAERAVEALIVCRDIQVRCPGTLQEKQALYYQASIQRPGIQSTALSQVYPKINFPVEISYKNLDSVHVYVLPYNETEYEKWQYSDEQLHLYLEGLLPQAIWKTAVRVNDPRDYNEHQTQIAVSGLQAGGYVLFMRGLGGQVSKSQPLSNQVVFQVSAIQGYVFSEYRKEKEQNRVLVFDTKTGAPVSGAVVKFWKREYDYELSEYKKPELLWSASTQKDGMTAEGYVLNDSYYYGYYTVEWKGNSFRKEFYGYQNYGNEENAEIQTSLFLDRKVYRPGQEVYFKGISFWAQNGMAEAAADTLLEVVVRDANYNEFFRKEYRTNDFGSFWGSFTLPQSGLNGSWYIFMEDGTGAEYFSVEEYKRPRFKVTMDSLKGTYTLGNEAVITGKAEALAGFAIDGAQVKYTVSRSGFARTYQFGKMMPFYSDETILQVGETTTNAQGEFSVAFELTPDNQFDSSSAMVFTYSVDVDITDYTGETRTGSTALQAGYRQYNLDCSATYSPFLLDSVDHLTIQITNLSGIPVKTNAQVKVYAAFLDMQTGFDYPFSEPDMPLLSKKDREKLFPEFKSSDYSQEFKKGNQIKAFSLSNISSEMLNLANLGIKEGGIYIVEIAIQDSLAGEIKEEVSFSVINPNSREAIAGLPFYMKMEMTGKREGNLIIGSGNKGQKAWIAAEYDGEILISKWVDISQSQKKIPVFLPEGMNELRYFAFSNYYGNADVLFESLSVVDSSTFLPIRLTTFRDEMEPGSTETWTLETDTAFDAEILATMYDASLDELGYSNSYYFSPRYTPLKRVDLSGLSYAAYYANRLSAGYDYIAGGYTYPTFPYRSKEIYFNFFSYENASSVLYGRFDWDFSGGYLSDKRGDYAVKETLAAGESEDEAQQTEIPFLSTNKNLEESMPPPASNASRSNFNELAFFYPQLRTDTTGQTQLKFTMPESITRWKFQALAHTRDLRVGKLMQEVTTSKKLMVNSFAPRFLREGDIIQYSAKVTNLTEKPVTGQTRLMVTDVVTGKKVEVGELYQDPYLQFTIPAGESRPFTWKVVVPQGVQGLIFDVQAGADVHTDGEAMTIPVFPNATLVTEALPLYMNGKGTADFVFEKIARVGRDTSLKPVGLTVEFMENPIWSVVQAMPYMLEFPYECSEQTFSRYYANLVATNILKYYPQIVNVLNTWKDVQPDAFLSALEKNAGLKQAVLEETPWLLDAKDESEAKRRVALLLDMNRMTQELYTNGQKLMNLQSYSGAFPWFEGGDDNFEISCYILNGLGELKKNQMLDSEMETNVLYDLVIYADERFGRLYDKWSKDTTTSAPVHLLSYLNARTQILQDYPAEDQLYSMLRTVATNLNGNLKQLNLQEKAWLAVALNRLNLTQDANNLLKALKQAAVKDSDYGTYWKTSPGWGWTEAPVETHVSIWDAVDEIAPDSVFSAGLFRWMMYQKTGNRWETTKATTQAIRAIVNHSYTLEQTEPGVLVQVGKTFVDPLHDSEIALEAGSGYFQKQIPGAEITSDMRNIQVIKATEGPGMGALYFQYVQPLNALEATTGEITLKRRVFKEVTTLTGVQMTEIQEGEPVSIGDRIIIRLEITAKRTVSFVHIRDMRAAALEPEQVTSAYMYSGGLYYYRSAKDAATNFFFDDLPRGTYTLEYAARVTHSGKFTNGIATLQSMYAPSLTSHSQGTELIIR